MNSKTETVGGVPRVFIYLFILNSFCCPWLSSIYYARRWGKVLLVHSSLDQKFQLGALTSSLHCILGQDTRIMKGYLQLSRNLGETFGSDI